MASRPYTVLSCAVSADGCLDDLSRGRLILSGPEDLDEVDELRASCDAILVGAGTIRADNPRLLVRSAGRVARRAGSGRPPHPVRVTVTSSGSLPAESLFFTGPGPRPLVYCPRDALPVVRARLGGVAEVADAGDPPTLAAVLSGLSERTIASVLIEGGSLIVRDALASGLVDELRLAIAPFFVGAEGAPRFAPPAAYPRTAAHPMRLVDARQVGQLAVLHYLLTDRPRPPPSPPPATRPPGST